MRASFRTPERGSRLKRQLDSSIGRPLVFAWGLCRFRRKQPKKIEHIGLLMLAAIGDSILASAILHDLRRAFPTARTTAFVSRSNREIVDLLEGFDEIVELCLGSPVVALAGVRSVPVDVMIDIGQWSRFSALLAAASRARFTVGFRTAGQQRHFAFDTTAEHSSSRHEIDNFRALTSCLGVTSTASPHFRQDALRGLQPPFDRPYVVLHPWASGYRREMREWSIENWAKVAQFAVDSGFAVVISGGPDDRPRAEKLAEHVQRPRRLIVVLAGRATLVETAAALARATAVVSVNTGTMHLAALLDRPMLALHGPTNPSRWGPLGSNSIIIAPGPQAGGAYLNLGFEYPASPVDCMAAISPDAVTERLRELLDRTSPQRGCGL